MRSHGRSTRCTEEQEYIVMKTASAKSARTMANQVGGSYDGRARMTRRRQGSAGGQTRIDIGGLTGLTSKPGSQSRRAAACDRFDRFGPQNRGADLVRPRSGRRASGAITKLASRRSEVVKAMCPSSAPTKSWTILPLRGRLL